MPTASRLARALLTSLLAVPILSIGTPSSAVEGCPVGAEVCELVHNACVNSGAETCPVEDGLAALAAGYETRSDEMYWESPIIEIPARPAEPPSDRDPLIEWASGQAQGLLEKRCSMFLGGIAKYVKANFTFYIYEYGRAIVYTDCPDKREPSLRASVKVTDQGVQPLSDRHYTGNSETGTYEANAIAEQDVNLYEPPFDYHGPGGTITWEFTGRMELKNPRASAYFCMKADDTIGPDDMMRDTNYVQVTAC